MKIIAEYPTFNYKTPYILMISIFGIIFVLSLTDIIVFINKIDITISSFIVIFLNVIAWIINDKLEKDAEFKKKWGQLDFKDHDRYTLMKMITLVIIESISFIEFIYFITK